MHTAPPADPTKAMTDPAMNALLTAFADEAEALEDLAACADGQLAALRDGALDAFEESGLDTAEAVAALDRAGRERAARLAALARSVGEPEDAPLDAVASRLPDGGRDLLEARDHVRRLAATAGDRCEALAFAVRYAARLGQATLEAWQGLGAERPARVYTAAGASADGAPARGLLNQTG